MLDRPNTSVGSLPFPLVRIGGAIGVVGRSNIHSDGSIQRDLWNPSRRADQVCLGVGAVGLLALVVQFAAVLVKCFIADTRGDRAGEFAHSVIEFHKVIAPGVDGVGGCDNDFVKLDYGVSKLTSTITPSI